MPATMLLSNYVNSQQLLLSKRNSTHKSQTVRKQHVCCHAPSSSTHSTGFPEHHVEQQQQQQQQSGHGQIRRAFLLSSISAATGACLFLLSPAAPVQASVTLTIRPKPQLKELVLKGGYSVTVPDTWPLAYDRGTQAFFGNFRTFETLSITQVQRPEGNLSPAQLLDWVLAEQRDNQSTYAFQLLSGDTPTERVITADGSGGGDRFYDAEYTLAICRGAIQEGSGGTRRCIGPRDMDLEVVSRTFFQTFAVRGDTIYVARGSSTTDKWQEVRPVAMEAVQSFRLPAEV